MLHKATKTERILCDVITSMDAQMKAKGDRIAELEAEVARLSDELQSKGKDNHIYREGKLAGFSDGFDRGVEAAAILISKRADFANEGGYTLDYVYGVQGCVDVIRTLKQKHNTGE